MAIYAMGIKLIGCCADLLGNYYVIYINGARNRFESVFFFFFLSIGKLPPYNTYRTFSSLFVTQLFSHRRQAGALASFLLSLSHRFCGIVCSTVLYIRGSAEL